MKVKVVDRVKIKTPRGNATLEKYVWKSDDKMFELELNDEFGKTAPFITTEYVMFGVAQYVMADQAIRKYGGKITETKEHVKTINDNDIL